MSSEDTNLFPRLSYLVDNYLDGVGSRLCKIADMERQNFSKWKKNFEEKGQNPNPEYESFKPIIEYVIDETDISPIWLLTGRGEPEISPEERLLARQSADLKRNVDRLRNSELSEGEIFAWILKNREDVVSFLDNLE